MYFCLFRLIFAVLLASAVGSDTLKRKRLQRMRSMGNFTKMFGQNATRTTPPGYSTAGPASRTGVIGRLVGRHQSTSFTLPQQSKSRRLGDVGELAACSSAAESWVSAAWSTKQCDGLLYEWWSKAPVEEGTATSSEVAAELLQNVSAYYYLPSYYYEWDDETMQKWKDHTWLAKETVGSLVKASGSKKDTDEYAFLPQEFCDCSESAAEMESYYYMEECVYYQLEKKFEGDDKAKYAKQIKEINSELKKNVKKMKPEACAHICQTESAALDQAMESLTAECSSTAKKSFLETWYYLLVSDRVPVESDFEDFISYIGETSIGDWIRIGLSSNSADPIFQNEFQLFKWWKPPDFNENGLDYYYSEASKFATANGYSEDDAKKAMSSYCREPFLLEYYYDFDSVKTDMCSCPFIAQVEAAYQDLKECVAREVEWWHVPAWEALALDTSVLKEGADATANGIKGCKSNIPKVFQDLCEGVDGAQEQVFAVDGAQEQVTGPPEAPPATTSNAYVKLPWLVPALVLAQY